MQQIKQLYEISAVVVGTYVHVKGARHGHGTARHGTAQEEKGRGGREEGEVEGREGGKKEGRRGRRRGGRGLSER